MRVNPLRPSRAPNCRGSNRYAGIATTDHTRPSTANSTSDTQNLGTSTASFNIRRTVAGLQSLSPTTWRFDFAIIQAMPNPAAQ